MLHGASGSGVTEDSICRSNPDIPYLVFIDRTDGRWVMQHHAVERVFGAVVSMDDSVGGPRPHCAGIIDKECGYAVRAEGC